MMFLGRQLFAVSFILGSNSVAGVDYGRSSHEAFQRVTAASTYNGGYEQKSNSPTVYQTGVPTTEMSYYTSSPKSATKQSYHADYEYVAAGDPGGNNGYTFTHAPTSMEYASLYGKSSKSKSAKESNKAKGKKASVKKASVKKAKKGKAKNKKKGKKGGSFYPTYSPCKSFFACMLRHFNQLF